MSRGQVEFGPTFEKEARAIVERTEKEALDNLEEVAGHAIKDVLRQMLGARWEHWDRIWKFEPNAYDTRGNQMVPAIAAKARELAPAIIEKALEQPIEFSARDLARVRSSLKEATLEAIESSLREKAREIADEFIEKLKVPAPEKEGE
jgi:hypothetical protein